MKLDLKPGGAARALKALKLAKPKKVVLSPDSALLGAEAGRAALREVADLCIEQGAQLRIEGVAPCLLPGYARYLAAAGPGAQACPEKERCFLRETCSGIPARHSGSPGLFKPPPRAFTDLEKCMLAILAGKDGLTTAQVLKAAKGIKICASCSNEGEVFRAAERLIRFGLVSKEYRGGVYLWKKITS